MTDDELRAWVNAWAATYPHGADAVLNELDGQELLDRHAMETVVQWKFSTDHRRLANARRGLAEEPDGRIEDATRRAFACNDDFGALQIVCDLSYVGPALGSSVLMANDPERYTVIDTRALKSLRSLELLGPGPEDATAGEWLDYLAACRSVRDRTGAALRVVDRALYQAAGRRTLPGTG